MPVELAAVVFAALLGYALRLPSKAAQRVSELETQTNQNATLLTTLLPSAERVSQLERKAVEASTLLATGMTSIGDQLAGIRTDMRDDRRLATENTTRLFERITAVEGRIVERINGVEQRVSRLEERTSNP